jgi:hypothetical protein
MSRRRCELARRGRKPFVPRTVLLRPDLSPAFESKAAPAVELGAESIQYPGLKPKRQGVCQASLPRWSSDFFQLS